MCLIAIAHRASPLFPLVLMANRDEAYERATQDAHFWSDAPGVLGGRDGLHGGSWLAVTRGGRFAAVTNLRGAVPRPRSRGALVGGFVRSQGTVARFAKTIARQAGEYSGFHLLAGTVGETLMHIAPGAHAELEPGIHGVSNAPAGEHWPKVGLAVATMRELIESSDERHIVDEAMRFLTAPRGTARVESEVFIAGDVYGTRSSTVILASPAEIVFAEQSHARGGVTVGERRTFRVPRDRVA